ncbi:MAG: oligosaccharide flippase family protein [Bacteroidales bacterium]|nr:oligosaccharide flippase family protein [Bacteroidales bacterium]
MDISAGIWKSEYTHVIRIMAVASMIQMVIIMPSTLLRVQEKATLYTLGNIVQMIVMLSFTVWFIVGLKWGIESIYYAQILGLIAYLAILSKFIVINVQLRFETKLLKEIIVFCLPLFISTLAVVLLNQADRLIIKYYGQLGDVGLYTLAFRLSNTLNILLVASISFAIQPLIYKKMDDPNNKRFYSKLMTYFVFVVMIFVMGMAFFGKEFVKLFARREEYYASFELIPILSLAILFNMMKDMAMIGLQITKKTGVIAAIVVAVSASGILLNFLLVPAFQNQGAALARFIAAVIFFLLVYFYSQRAYRIPYEMKKLLLMILLAIMLYLPVIWINELNLFIRIITKSFLIAVYPILLYLFNFFEKAEVDAIKFGWEKWSSLKNFGINIKGVFRQ